MKIAKIWNNDYPWDVRVEKICKALVDDGHVVHLICRNLNRAKTRDEIDGIQIHRLYPIKNSLLNNISSIVAFLNPVWIHRIYQVVKHEKVDVLLVRDLPLVISALLVGNRFEIPVVFDMAENYPSMWKEHVDKRNSKFFNHLLKNSTVATLMENYVLKRVDHTIVVVEESKDRLIKKGISENKISIVSNTPDLKLFKGKSDVMDDIFSDRFIMLYVGYLNGGRGLDTAIKAVPILKEKLNEVCLIIAGDGEYMDELRNLVNKLGIEKHVDFLGWVDSKLIPSYIYNSDVCIVPHDATDFVNSTIPNKLFDYMACKKPVLVSDAVPLKRIVNETECGMVFRSRDIEDFAEKVIKLKELSVRTKMGLNGFAAINSKYNWKHDSQTLRDIFRKNIYRLLQN